MSFKMINAWYKATINVWFSGEMRWSIGRLSKGNYKLVRHEVFRGFVWVHLEICSSEFKNKTDC